MVTILNQGQSAGNNLFIWIGTSETTCKSIESNDIEIPNSSENIKLISEDLLLISNLHHGFAALLATLEALLVFD
jgi:hypothetical protein